ncbi:MAG: heavy metal translocating P-type ATPase metal-binding domain-containing protein [Kiritimatiellia bacterium]
MSSQASESPPPDAPCVHCQTLCGKTGVYEEQNAFCCRGCAMVYRILHGSGLEKFYELDAQAGQRADQSPEAQAYDFLADPEVKRKLIDFSDGHTTRITLHLPQIHCGPASGCWSVCTNSTRGLDMRRSISPAKHFPFLSPKAKSAWWRLPTCSPGWAIRRNSVCSRFRSGGSITPGEGS